MRPFNFHDKQAEGFVLANKNHIFHAVIKLFYTFIWQAMCGQGLTGTVNTLCGSGVS